MDSGLKFRLIGISVFCATMPMLGLGQWAAGSGGSIYYNGGNVGIGTTTPGNTLAIVTDEPTGGPQLMITNTSPANYTQLGFEGTGQTFQVGVGNASEQVYGVANKYYIYDANAAAMRFVVDSSGNVGIGTTAPQYLLSVNGTIQAKEVIVNTGWSDYVFDPDYHLESLDEISAYIKENHHLPGIPSTAEVKAKGVSLGAVDAKLLAKVEELTLQMIRLNDRDKRLQGEVSDLKKQILNANPPARGITH